MDSLSKRFIKANQRVCWLLKLRKERKFPEPRLWATLHPESSPVYSDRHANAGCNALSDIVTFVNGPLAKNADNLLERRNHRPERLY